MIMITKMKAKRIIAMSMITITITIVDNFLDPREVNQSHLSHLTGFPHVVGARARTLLSYLHRTGHCVGPLASLVEDAEYIHHTLRHMVSAFHSIDEEPHSQKAATVHAQHARTVRTEYAHAGSSKLREPTRRHRFAHSPRPKRYLPHDSRPYPFYRNRDTHYTALSETCLQRHFHLLLVETHSGQCYRFPLFSQCIRFFHRSPLHLRWGLGWKRGQLSAAPCVFFFFPPGSNTPRQAFDCHAYGVIPLPLIPLTGLVDHCR